MPLGATDISMIQIAASGSLSSDNIDLETIYKLYVNGDATGNFGLDDMANQDYPTVATNAASSVTSTSMTCNGTISADGNVLGDITQRGFYFGTTAPPGALLNTKVNAGGTAIAAYTLSRTGLTAGQTYYITAYAINALGERQGSTVSQATAVALTSFTYVSAIGGGGESDGDAACAFVVGEDAQENTGYHDGSLASGFPTSGDNVYTDSGGTTSLANGFYRMESGAKGGNQSFRMVSGDVDSIEDCG